MHGLKASVADRFQAAGAWQFCKSYKPENLAFVGGWEGRMPVPYTWCAFGRFLSKKATYRTGKHFKNGNRFPLI